MATLSEASPLSEVTKTVLTCPGAWASGRIFRQTYRLGRQRAYTGSDSFSIGSLIDMYAKCGFIADALSIFDGGNHHGVPSWQSYNVEWYGKEAIWLLLGIFARCRLMHIGQKSS